MSQRNGRHGSWARVEQRVNEVYRWIVAGLSTQQIHKLANNPEPDSKREPWNVSRRTVDTYIAKARARFIEDSRADRQEELGKAKARYEADRAAAVLRQDHRGAAVITDKIVTLLGLKVPERIEVTEILSLVDSEIARREREIAELEAQYALEPPPGG